MKRRKKNEINMKHFYESRQAKEEKYYETEFNSTDFNDMHHRRYSILSKICRRRRSAPKMKFALRILLFLTMINQEVELAIFRNG